MTSLAVSQMVGLVTRKFQITGIGNIWYPIWHVSRVTDPSWLDVSTADNRASTPGLSQMVFSDLLELVNSVVIMFLVFSRTSDY